MRIREATFEEIKDTSFHQWVIKSSKTQIMKALGIKPEYSASGDTHYDWVIMLDEKFPFTIYDMSNGERLGKDQVIEFHVGYYVNYFDENGNYLNGHSYDPPCKEVMEFLEDIGIPCVKSDFLEAIEKRKENNEFVLEFGINDEKIIKQ